jgi:hypothetical protein
MELDKLMYIHKKYDRQQYNSYKSFVRNSSLSKLHGFNVTYTSYTYPFLSHVDIGLHIYKKRRWDFNIRQMSEKSLLNSPLHTWDGILKKYISRDQIMNMLMPMVSKKSILVHYSITYDNI